MRKFISCNITKTLSVFVVTLFCGAHNFNQNIAGKKFSIVRVKFDGDVKMGIQHGKTDVKLDTVGDCEKEVIVKEGVLFISCKRLKKHSPLEVDCNMSLPSDVKLVVVNAGAVDCVVSSYSGALECNIGSFTLFVDSNLSRLIINAGTLNAKLRNINYDTK